MLGIFGLFFAYKNNQSAGELDYIHGQLITQRDAGMKNIQITEVSGRACELLTGAMTDDILCPSCVDIAQDIFQDFTVTSENLCYHNRRREPPRNILNARAK